MLSIDWLKKRINEIKRLYWGNLEINVIFRTKKYKGNRIPKKKVNIQIEIMLMFSFISGAS